MKKVIKNRIIALHIIIAMFVLLIGCPVTVQAKTGIQVNLKVDEKAGICEYSVDGVSFLQTTAITLQVMRADNNNVVLEKQIALSIDNCPDNTFRGQFTSKEMNGFQGGEYIVTVDVEGEKYVAQDLCYFSAGEGETGGTQQPVVSEKPVVSAQPTPSQRPSSSAKPTSSVQPSASQKPSKPVEWKFSVDSKTGASVRTFVYAPTVSGHPSTDSGCEAGIYVWKKGTDETKAVLAGDKQILGTKKLTWKTDIKKYLNGYGTYYAKLAVLKSDKLETKEETHFIIQPGAASFTAKVTNALEAKQSFQVNLNGIENPYGVKSVSFQVYNSSNKSVYICPQKAVTHSGTNYSFLVSMKNLNYRFDKYTIKAFVTDKNGNEKRLSSVATIDRKVKAGSLKVTNKSDKTIKFVLKDAYIPGKIAKVSYKVFYKADGSAKSKTYSASCSSNTYSGSMSIASFPYKKAGTYQVYAYGETKWNKKVLLNKSTFHISAAKATVKGKSPNYKDGTFAMTVSGIKSNSGVKQVALKVWRTGETKDAVTYKAIRQSNGTYQIKVYASKHDYHLGTYHAKAYVTMGNGIKVKAASCSYTFKPVNFVYMKASSQKHCKKVYVYNPSKKGTVTFQVYSKTKGTDDSKTYKAKKSGSTYYATIKLTEIKHAGTVIVKAKVNNKVVRTYTFKMKKSDLAKNGWRYETYQGQTYKFYYKDGAKVTDLTGILGIKESTSTNVNNFKVVVNRAACCVTVYAYDSKKKAYCIPVKTCTVSVGRDTWTNKGTSGLHEDSSYTPIGDYSICSNGTSVKYTMKPMYEPDGSICYARWASHVVGNVYFHSVAVSSDSHYALSPSNYNRLGSPASAGCIRMTVADAKWFYDYVSKGTPVKIETGSSSYPGPLGKNATIKIDSSIHYDPTDPAVPLSTKKKDYKAGKISGYMTAGGKKVGY